MNTRLKEVPNWPELARQADWSIAKLSKLCGVSQRVLERHFLENVGKTPRSWLAEHRQHCALQLLSGGSSVKEAAAYLGYKQATNFSRAFSKHWGSYPTVLVSQAKAAQAQNVAK